MSAYSLNLPNVPLGQRLFKLLYSTPRLTVKQTENLRRWGGAEIETNDERMW